MSRIQLMLAAIAVFVTSFASAATETVGDYEWTYEADGDYKARITSVYHKTSADHLPTGAVTIPETLDSGYRSVTKLGDYLFMNCTNMTSVTIPSTVELIGYETFQNCKGLSSISLPSSLERIASCAFYGLTINSIDIPASVTEIEYYAFGCCHSLSAVTLHEGLQTIGDSVFSGCTNLSSCTLPNSVSKIGSYAFYNTALTSVQIPNGLELIANYAFMDCRKLSSVTLPESLVNIGAGAFYGTGLTSIDLPDGLKTIGESAFSESLLSQIEIPDGVAQIPCCTFFKCTNLVSVTLPTALKSIDDQAFYECKALTSIALPEGVTNIGKYAFGVCSALTQIELPNSLQTLGKSAFSVSGLQSIDFGDGITVIENETCYMCTSLSSIRLPCGLRKIGEKAFYDTDNLSEVDIPASVSTIGTVAFATKRYLTSNTMTMRFAGQQPVVPERDNDYIFRYGGDYVTVYVPTNASWSAAIAAGKWQGATIKSLAEYPGASGYTFTYEILSGLGWKVTGVSPKPASGAWLVVPSQYNGTNVVAIGANAFEGCSGASQIIIPDTVTMIEANAFKNCTGLTSISFPASLATLSPSALTGCTGLETVIFNGTHLTMTDALYADAPSEMKTLVSWEMDYNNWAKEVTGGTWMNRPIEWLRPIEEAWSMGVVVYDSSNNRLAFYADDVDHSSEGSIYLVCNWDNSHVGYPMWCRDDTRTNVTNVVFDTSFTNCSPKYLAKWFDGFAKVTDFSGLENLNTSSATNMAGMFLGCSSVEKLNLVGFDTEKVETMKQMFHSCNGLTTVYVSTNFVTTALVSDGDLYMFTDCTNIVGGNGTAYNSKYVGKDRARIDRNSTKGYFSSLPTAKAVWDDTDYSFTLCYDSADYSDMREVWEFDPDDVPDTVPEWIDYGVDPDYVTIDDSFRRVKPRSTYAWFQNMDDITEIAGFTNIDTSETVDMAQMFSECAKLENLDFSHFNTAKATSMYGMFEGCEALTDLDFTSFITTNVFDMGGMFSGCYSLTNLNVSSFVTDKVIAWDYMFSHCTALKTLDISSFNLKPSSADIEGLFYNDEALTTIYASEEFVLEGEIGLCFCNCTSLVGGAGTPCVGNEDNFDARFGHIDGGTSNPGYFTLKASPLSGFSAWAAEQGLTGADAAWDAKPLRWNGWANAFIYTYGEGLADGSLSIMSIRIDSNAKPVITTTPVVEGHTDFTPAVIGSPSVNIWTSPVILDKAGDTWTLPVGEEASFFRVRLTK